MCSTLNSVMVLSRSHRVEMCTADIALPCVPAPVSDTVKAGHQRHKTDSPSGPAAAAQLKS